MIVRIIRLNTANTARIRLWQSLLPINRVSVLIMNIKWFRACLAVLVGISTQSPSMAIVVILTISCTQAARAIRSSVNCVKPALKNLA